ncbi:hypothetical protein K3495_g13277 [Podosphaera aphanis]|nr:hypothetical protein K3495_g14602 [Podosphaera aphanis]KAI0994904.1 hypothetical protein K3495_g13277 [Podosphaera aphanis]
MDWTPTPVNMAALKPITEQERDYLRANNGCFRCRQTNAGHISRTCPRNQIHARAAAIKKPGEAVTTVASDTMSENGGL